MRLVRFLVRLVIKSVGVVLLLLLVLVAGLWIRGRWTSEEMMVSWVHHERDGDEMHATQFNLGGNVYVNDTEREVMAAAPTTAPTTGPTSQPATALELSKGVERTTYPYSVISPGPGKETKFSILGMEYGEEKSEAGTYRWMLTPWWVLTAVLALPIVLWLGLYAVAGRRRNMMCTSCHHDLSQPIHRCPECGATLRKPLHVV